MKISKSTNLLAALTIAGLVSSTSAETLAYYDIESSLTAADSEGAAGLTASTMDATSAGGTSSNFEWVGSRVPYWFTGTIGSGTDPQVDDIVATFSLTPEAGNQIDLGTAGTFNLGALAYGGTSVNGTTNDYIATVRIFVASDSEFTNILATSTTLTDSRLPGADSAPTIGSLDLDVAVSSSSTLYFGVAMTDEIVGSVPGSPNSRFDGVAVNGTIGVVSGPAVDPQITSIAVSGNTATVVMTGAPGTDYYCAGSADLTGWTTEIVPTSPPGGSPFQTDANGDLTFTVDTTSLGPVYFFRVQDTDPSP